MDFSSFFSLLKVMSKPFTRIGEVFNFKTFFKERRYLHFIVSFLIVGLFYFGGSQFKTTQISYYPWWVVLIFGWMVAYGINYSREWVLKVRGKAEWDILDIFAGAYGGGIAAVVYLLVPLISKL